MARSCSSVVALSPEWLGRALRWWVAEDLTRGIRPGREWVHGGSERSALSSPEPESSSCSVSRWALAVRRCCCWVTAVVSGPVRDRITKCVDRTS